MDRTTDFGSVSEGSNPSVVTNILKNSFLVSKDFPMNWDDEANASKVN